VKLPEDFEKFYEKIVLSQRQTDRIQSAANALADFLTKEFSLGAGEVFLQGSFPNGTAIKPDPEKKDGEYDVDLVAICAEPEDEPKEALDRVERALQGNGTYRSMIDRDPKRPCVRLKYADDDVGGFHVDVVPARVPLGQAPLEIPRPVDGWRESAPKEYTDWCKAQGDEFARSVQMLKRWRDHNQTARAAIKSILLQVLTSRCLSPFDNDAERIAAIFHEMATLLAGYDQAPVISNPVLPSENLADRWDVAAYRDFQIVLAEAAQKAQEALTEKDFNRSRELWQELFGKDFPGPQGGDDDLTPPSPPPGRGRRPQKAPRVEWG
jgi:SMODS domain-containing protein